MPKEPAGQQAGFSQPPPSPVTRALHAEPTPSSSDPQNVTVSLIPTPGGHVQVCIQVGSPPDAAFACDVTSSQSLTPDEKSTSAPETSASAESSDESDDSGQQCVAAAQARKLERGSASSHESVHTESTSTSQPAQPGRPEAEGPVAVPPKELAAVGVKEEVAEQSGQSTDTSSAGGGAAHSHGPRLTSRHLHAMARGLSRQHVYMMGVRPWDVEKMAGVEYGGRGVGMDTSQGAPAPAAPGPPPHLPSVSAPPVRNAVAEGPGPPHTEGSAERDGDTQQGSSGGASSGEVGGVPAVVTDDGETSGRAAAARQRWRSVPGTDGTHRHHHSRHPGRKGHHGQQQGWQGPCSSEGCHAHRHVHHAAGHARGTRSQPGGSSFGGASGKPARAHLHEEQQQYGPRNWQPPPGRHHQHAHAPAASTRARGANSQPPPAAPPWQTQPRAAPQSEGYGMVPPGMWARENQPAGHSPAVRQFSQQPYGSPPVGAGQPSLSGGSIPPPPPQPPQGHMPPRVMGSQLATVTEAPITSPAPQPAPCGPPHVELTSPAIPRHTAHMAASRVSGPRARDPDQPVQWALDTTVELEAPGLHVVDGHVRYEGYVGGRTDPGGEVTGPVAKHLPGVGGLVDGARVMGQVPGMQNDATRGFIPFHQSAAGGLPLGGGPTRTPPHVGHAMPYPAPPLLAPSGPAQVPGSQQEVMFRSGKQPVVATKPGISEGHDNDRAAGAQQIEGGDLSGAGAGQAEDVGMADTEVQLSQSRAAAGVPVLAGPYFEAQAAVNEAYLAALEQAAQQQQPQLVSLLMAWFYAGYHTGGTAAAHVQLPPGTQTPLYPAGFVEGVRPVLPGAPLPVPGAPAGADRLPHVPGPPPGSNNVQQHPPQGGTTIQEQR